MGEGALTIGGLEATSGFEPLMEVLQTSALPLGYVAQTLKNSGLRPEFDFRNGAEDETRTRDLLLGKEAFYH
jgi:hypothetical protein